MLYGCLPYPGLRPFDEQGGVGFVGREHEVDQLILQLTQSHAIALVGLSGSGKTSLLRAGLLPDLKESPLFAAGTWRILPIIHPGGDLRAALAAALGDADRPAEAVAALLAAQPGATRLLLVIDAFEELFTNMPRRRSRPPTRRSTR